MTTDEFLNLIHESLKKYTKNKDDMIGIAAIALIEYLNAGNQDDVIKYIRRAVNRYNYGEKRGIPKYDCSRMIYQKNTGYDWVDFNDSLNKLRSKEKEIVRLKLQEYTNEEIGKMVGVSKETVRKVLVRVLAQLL